MCGIAGLVRVNGALEGDGSLIPALVAMRDSMAHRGPDGKGCWESEDRRVGLAHRRLAIVDLSDAAAQPMSDSDGTVWVTFNG